MNFFSFIKLKGKEMLNAVTSSRYKTSLYLRDILYYALLILN